MTDDELLQGLRDTVRAENAAWNAETPDLPPSDPAFLERLTDLACAELTAPSQRPAPQRHNQDTRMAQLRSAVGKSAWIWPLAAAAAVMFVLLKGAPTAPLAQYRVEVVRGFERSTRDTAPRGDSLTLRAGLPFELTLRPASQTMAPLAAKVYLSQGQALVALPVQVEVTPLGVLHVRGGLPRTLDATARDSFLWVMVGRPDALPQPTSRESLDELRAQAGFQVFRIEILAPPP